MSDKGVATPKLDSIVADAGLTKVFEAFLQERFCFENLDFWRHAIAYKSLNTVEERRIAAQTIYQRFIAPDAQSEINIPSTTREPLLRDLLLANENLFDSAIIDVKRMLEWDSAAAFVTHQSYTDYKEAKENHNDKERGYFDLLTSPLKKRLLKSGPIAAPGSPRNIVKGLFSSPQKSKEVVSTPSREGTPKRSIGPKDKILKDKPDNRFSPIVKTASPRVAKASPAEKLARSASIARHDAENRLNGSPKGSPASKAVPRAQTAGAMPRKALALLGSTPPKHPVTGSPARTFSPFWNDVDPHDDNGLGGDEIDGLVNPTLNGSAHLRLRSNTF